MASAWYEENFDSLYSDIYRFAFTEAATAREVTAVLDLVKAVPRGARILDVCCGEGRHSLEFARRGYDVTGLDLSEEFLNRASEASTKERLPIRWVRADMRRIPEGAQFDVIVNLYQSFGFLENDHEDQIALNTMAAGLIDGGTLVMQLANRDAVVRSFDRSRFTILPDGLMVGERRDFDLESSRLKIEYSIIRERETLRRREFYSRLYSLSESLDMLRLAGLTCEASYATFDRTPLTLDSPQLVLVASK